MKTYGLNSLKRIASRLEKAGYIRYEVSNFCKPPHQAQHNEGIWRNESTLYGSGTRSSRILAEQDLELATRHLWKEWIGCTNLKVNGTPEQQVRYSTG